MSDNTQSATCRQAQQQQLQQQQQVRSLGSPVQPAAPTSLPKKQPTTSDTTAKQQNKTFSTFKGLAAAKQLPGRSNHHDRNSLESIQSRFSVSSATNEELSVQQHQKQHDDESQQRLSSNTNSSDSSSNTPSPTRDPPGRPAASSSSRQTSSPANGHPKTDLGGYRQSRDLSGSLGKNSELPVVAISERKSANRLQHQHHLASKTIAKDPEQSGRKGSQADAEDAQPPSASERAPKSSSIRAVPSRNEAKPPFPFAGILASILASVFFSTSTICVKLLPDSQGFEEKTKALFFRGALMSSICALAITCRGSGFSIPRDEIWINVLRSVFGTLGIFGSYCSLKYISPGDSTALVFSSPIWTSILSYFIFNEPLQWIQLLALPACLFGIVLIAHPALIVNVDHLAINHHHQHHYLPGGGGGDTNNATDAVSEGLQLMVESSPSPALVGIGPQFEHRWPGIVIALCVSLMVSCVYIVLKFRKTTPIQTTTFWLGVFMSVTAIAVMSGIGFGDLPDTWREWLLLIGLGITSWLGQSCLQWAFFYEAAGLLAIVRTLDVAMTFIMSAIFLEEDIYWTSILGASIIGLVVVSVMLNNWIKTMTCMSGLEKQVDSTGSTVLEVAKELKSISRPMLNSKKNVYTISKAA